MITPVFEISQTDEAIIVIITAPHADLAEIDFDHSEESFTFSCPPYFLRLYFKQLVEDYARRPADIKFDSDKGTFELSIRKLNRGEHFTHLDMLTELIRPTRTIHGNQMVEVEAEEGEEEQEEGGGDEFLADQQNVRNIATEINEMHNRIDEFGYGFGWRKMGVLERLRSEIGRIGDLENPGEVGIGERKELCEEYDRNKFDEGRYLSDTLDPDEELNRIVDVEFAATLAICQEDREKLKDLNVKKPIRIRTDEDHLAVGRSLMDMIYAWCYDQRVNEWEGCCESGWTCHKLSPTLSFFVRWDSFDEAAVGSIRRALTFALYRNWNLARKVLADTKRVFSEGRTAILHVLCDIHRSFIRSGEFRYILNDLFITDYLLWIQSVDESILETIRNQVEKVRTPEKSDIGLEIDVLELQAKMENVLDSDDEED